MISQIIACIIAFLTSYFLTPFFIKYFKKCGIVTRDVHKKRKPLLPNSLGIPFLFGVSLGLFFYIFVQVYFYSNFKEVSYIFASLSSLFLISLAGFLDDLNSSQVKVGKYLEGKEGLKRLQKVLMTFPAALPLMVVMVGDTTMNIPFIGSVDFGILYPLLIVPIGVIGAANMVNMLDGFNGLDTGMGLVYTFSLGLFAWIHSSYIAAIIFFVAFSSLLACFRYNFYPAKILSGDSLTYSLGAIIAIGAIVGNMERAAIITSLPFIIQGILKFYSKIKLGYFASDLGILEKDGTIKSKYGKNIYSWTHLAMQFKLKEWQISLFMIFIQAIFSILAFLWIFCKSLGREAMKQGQLK